MLNLIASLVVAGVAATQPVVPTVRVLADDTKITESCRVVIDPGVVIEDLNGDGVIHIAADDVTVEFADGSVLVGAKPGTDPDTFKGVGISIRDHKGVTLKNARVSGFKVGIQAERTPGLTIDGAELVNNFRQRLRSTPKAEHGGDWLWPHRNDGGEWLRNYGAALAVKDARGIVIRKVKVRQGQNGMVLDRVVGGQIYDNDCSFLSGWGIAMWRCSSNVISRNALDFCVRGYSHGVYNRGQDSAGLLMFEQNNRNIIAENSITHGGDGIFGFAGHEAIGETPAPDGFNYRRKGNNDNLFIGNDLSYAPAHGLEMTFSYGNRILKNRFVGNAICGIWGGYSQETLIAGNLFEGNGDMAYGLERGGVNIEHGADNLIIDNTFKNNKCGVHLWWDDDGALFSKPGVAANYKGVSGNVIAGNTFEGDALVLQLRDASRTKDKVTGTVFANNTLKNVGKEIDAKDIDVIRTGETPEYAIPDLKGVVGETRPVGARAHLAGRENIIMTEWGPWDHEGPLVRALQSEGARHVYEFRNIDPRSVEVTGRSIRSKAGKAEPGKPWTLTIDSSAVGVRPYTLSVNDPALKQEINGALLSVRWDVVVFPWEGEPGPNPPPDLEAWRAAAKLPAAKRAKTDRLSFQFGSGGPSDVDIAPEITNAKFRGDYFGLIATARVPLTKGKWRLSTLSDDGVRVLVDGKPLIENWTHHGATRDTAELEVKGDRAVEITVEYFEIYGAAVLDFQIEPIP